MGRKSNFTPRKKLEQNKARKQAEKKTAESTITSIESENEDVADQSTTTPAKNKGGRPPKRRPSAPLTPLSTRPPQEFPSTSAAEPMDTADIPSSSNHNISESEIPSSSNQNISDSEYSNNEMCVGGEEEQPKLRRIETRKDNNCHEWLQQSSSIESTSPIQTSCQTPKGTPNHCQTPKVRKKKTGPLNKNSDDLLLIHAPNSDAIRSARKLTMSDKQRREFDKQFTSVLSAYMSGQQKKLDNKQIKQGNMNAEGRLPAQKYLEAEATLAANKYCQEYKEDPLILDKTPKFNNAYTHRCHKVGCASKSANHMVPYYDTGFMGDEYCAHCSQALYKHEKILYTTGQRRSHCCNNGQTNTAIMVNELEELQNPVNPTSTNRQKEKTTRDLAMTSDKQTREAFLNNTMKLNNNFAFGSIKCERAPDEQLGSRKDTCKYNGELCCQLGDIEAPPGRPPLFAQTYTITPEAAMNIRENNIQGFAGPVKRHILMELENIMRACHPFATTFKTAREKYDEAKQKYGKPPQFSLVILSSRELHDDALINRDDCTIIERADAPTAKQVAVIWVNEEGEAPFIKGFVLHDKAGKLHEMRPHNPNVDPACFPLLHINGTQGWRFGLKKRKYLTNEEKEQEAMESEIYVANANDDISAMSGIDSDCDDALNEEDIDADDVDPDECLDEANPPIPANTSAMSGLDTGCVEDINQENIVAEDIVLDPDDCVMENNDDDDKAEGPKRKSGPDKNISYRQFVRYRLGWGKSDIQFELSRSTQNKKREHCYHWLWTFRRLAEYFLISVINRIERMELDHTKLNQQNLRTIMANDYVNAIEAGLAKEGRTLGKIFQVPKTFKGSNKFYQKAYADLMTVVRRIGNPTWFVTFTGNPAWPEIQSQLLPGQSWEHRADLVCRIFMHKAAEFLTDTTKRHVLGKMKGWCYSVEHQKRGMPHIHLLLISDPEHRIETPKEVDEYVSARIPPLPPDEDHSPDAMQQRRLWFLVTKCMMHDCNNDCLEQSTAGVGLKCKKHFPKNYSDHTELSAVKYTEYIRIPPADETIAEHIRAIRENNSVDPNNDPHNTVQYKRVAPRVGKNASAMSGSKESATNSFNIGKRFPYDTCGIEFKKLKPRKRVPILMDDRNVVPYNPFLLLKYNCHINVEYCFGQKSCKYIFKYLLKGFEKGYVKVVQPGKKDEYDFDEMAALFKVRYMTSMEAYLRLHSYKIVGLSHKVESLSAHTPDGETIVIEEGHEQRGNAQIGKESKLTGFFDLCKRDKFAATKRYDEIPYFYCWDRNKRLWKRRVNDLEDDPAKATKFIRIYTVSPKNKKLFAIRCLLLHRIGPKSFTDLLTIDGHKCDDFPEAAEKAGLMDSDDIYIETMQEACAEKMNLRRLQHFFAMLLFHCTPSKPMKLFDDFLDEMLPPPINADHGNQRARKLKVLSTLEYYFRGMGTTCSKMCLEGLPDDYDHEKVAEEIEGESLMDDFYGNGDRRKKTPQQIALEGISKLNKEQTEAFKHIKKALVNQNHDNKLFFLEGAGGCGKTFLYNALIRWCLAGKPEQLQNDCHEWPQNSTLNRGSVITAASTGIAGILLIGGGTVHSKFHVPNTVDKTTTPQVAWESAEAIRFRNAELIIIDEVSMLHRDVLSYVNKLLKDVAPRDGSEKKPFGGKCIILGGDWKQLCPVIVGGGRPEQVNASIKKDPLFNSFKILRLTKNMRADESEVLFREWLLQIGNAKNARGNHSASPLNIPDGQLANNLEELISFCFPRQFFQQPYKYYSIICESALLCPLNKEVERVNKIAVDQMQGIAKEYLSIDMPYLSEDPLHLVSTYRADFNLEAVHNETPTGLPPHKLTIKEGAPVMLIKNLDVAQGLCNGTRMQIISAKENTLRCRLLTGTRVGTEVLIPKIKFTFGDQPQHRGMRFTRLQFPVRLCFGMTVNKSQGQTLKRVGLALLDQQCFSHGQIYVAMSRATNMGGIRVFSPSSTYHNIITNVVYRELLDVHVAPPVPVPVPIPIRIEAPESLSDDDDISEASYNDY